MKKESWRDTLRFVIIALCIIVPIRLFIAEPFIVSGHSMDPTFSEHQYLIIDRLTYTFHEPRRGDVIVFKYPKDPRVYYIKRIIGLPGETVSISSENTTITTTDKKTIHLNENFVTNKDTRPFQQTTTLGAGQYFVMGDNRPVSSDSRIWGVLDKQYIIGTPVVSLYPLSTLRLHPGAHQY